MQLEMIWFELKACNLEIYSLQVHFYGAMFREGDVWICMEVMDISLDKFYTKATANNIKIPETVLGKIAFSVSYSLKYIFVVNAS